VSASVPGPSPLPPILPGSVLAGKYRVERILGQGGMGLVVEARHIALEERVALKFLLPEHARQPDSAARFLREARAAVKIKSEHVARVSDVGELESGAPYMVMEYLEGKDLSAILDARGVLHIGDAIDFVIQACEAIAEAHTYGIIHRDLKPGNLFLSARPDGSPIVKVLDFGISKVMGNVDALTRTSAAIGSALYMSPEQMQQTRTVDHRADVYSLGVSLFEMLGGKQPFYAETLPQLCAEILTGAPTPLRTLRPDASQELAAVLEKAYARDREARYQSVAEFVIALAPFASHRAQANVERVVRMAGKPIPEARSSSPGLSISGSGLQIIPGPYTAPASARASALFAAGANTNMGLSRTGSTARGSRSRAPVIAAVLAGSLTLGAIVAVIAWSRGRATRRESAPITTEAAPAMSGAAADSAAPTLSASPGPTAPAAPPGSASAAVTPNGEPTAPEQPTAPDTSASAASSTQPAAKAPSNQAGRGGGARRPSSTNTNKGGTGNPLDPPSVRNVDPYKK
jgi:eukaryotic-like serine/threonine-protein kinase